MVQESKALKHKHDKKNEANIHESGECSPLIGTKAATIEALKVLDRQGVVVALRGQKQGIADLLQNTDRSLSIRLAVVYAAGLIVENNDDEWNSLCEAEEWADHPKLKPKREEPLRAVLRLAVGFDGKKADSTVHRYHKALSPLFDEKVPAKDIPRRIQEAGGIEKMRQSAVRSIEVTATPEILRTLYEVTGTTTFKARLTIDPLEKDRSTLTILKLKPPMKK